MFLVDDSQIRSEFTAATFLEHTVELNSKERTMFYCKHQKTCFGMRRYFSVVFNEKISSFASNRGY